MLKKKMKDGNDQGQIYKALTLTLQGKEFSSKESMWDAVVMVTGQDL